MATSSNFDDPGYCPFLTAVVADRLWMRPIGVYCRRPGRPVRIPAESTLTGRCTGQYRLCDGYSEASAASRAEERSSATPGPRSIR